MSAYEISLAVVTLLGFLELHLMAVIAVSAVLVVLYALLMLKGKSFANAKAFITSILVGIVAWLAFMLILPSATMSSLAQVTYWVDWLFLGMISAGFAFVLTLLVYPVLALQHNKNNT
jgi:hypothetical protein